MLSKLRLLLLIFSLLLGVFTSAASAQTLSMWSMVLIDNTTGALLRVYADGTTRAYNLNLPPNTYVGANELAFTPDGERVAVCVTTYRDAEPQTDLRFIDLSAQPEPRELWRLPLESGQGCWLAINDAGDQLAISRVYYYTFADDAENADNPLPPYDLRVVNITDGSPVLTLDPRAHDLPTDFSMMLNVRRFSGDELIFAQVPWGTEYFPLPPAYRLSLTDGSLQTLADRWFHAGLVQLRATNELTWLELDTERAFAEALGPVPQANIVRYARGGDAPRAIYTNSEWLLLDTEFVNDGSTLAIFELEGVDPENFTSDMTPSSAIRWVALERDGSTRVLFESENAFSQIVSAPGGFMHLYSTPYDGAAPQTSILLDYHVVGRDPIRVWSSESTQGFTWSVAWSAPTTAPADLAEFPPVG